MSFEIIQSDPAVVKAINFARYAHAGQKRWGGEDYFTAHLDVVARYLYNNIHSLIGSRYWKAALMPNNVKIMVAAAYLHDVLEDTSATEADLLTTDIDPHVVAIVKNLTRKKENYAEFIMRINKSNIMTRAVKIADLRCNMSDLNEGAMKDKYRLAEHILLRGNEVLED